MNRVIDRVRRFNRFYTGQIGVLTEHLLHSEFSLTDVRILYEIAHRSAPTASAIAAELSIDPGYMSRILERFRRQRIVGRKTSSADARISFLSLTPKGRRIFRTLDTRANDEVAALLRQASSRNQRDLVHAMRTIETILAPAKESKPTFILRDPEPGDLGWIVHRHGALYWKEYRYDKRFEALVARVVAEFVDRFDAHREHCWIAEKEGEVVGSVFLVRHTDSVAKLRLLYVEPSARGNGIGERLIAECVGFARKACYRKITLWTQSELLAARHLYQKSGFVLVKEDPHESFGRDDLVAETWELDLLAGGV